MKAYSPVAFVEGSVSFNELTEESKVILVFVPWNFGESLSSRLVCAINAPKGSGKSIIIEAELVLNLPPSSTKRTKYSPSIYGTVICVLFPGNLSISVAFWNVPDPSVLGLWRILQKPPWSTSVSVLWSHLNLINFVFIGSILKFCTFPGTAVLPDAVKLKIEGLTDTSPIGFKLKTLAS